MFAARRPDADTIRGFLAAHSLTPLSYAPVGLAGGDAPGFRVDEDECVLGHGDAVFAAAKRQLLAWAPFRLGWVELHPRGAEIEVGAQVAVLARHLGFWSLNACRIVQVFTGDGVGFGFAYGTLRGHAECGEERFTVSQDAGGTVTYRVRAASRPGVLLTRLGGPVPRGFQARFRRESGEALRAAVATALGMPESL